MPSEIISVVTIPNGFTAKNQALRVSLYVAPRLSGAATLASFPDFLNWPGTLKSAGLQVTLECAGNQTTVTADTSVLDEKLWTAVFNRETYVDKFQPFDYSNRLILSYPVAGALSSIKNLYQYSAFQNPLLTFEQRAFREYLNGFRIGGDKGDPALYRARERLQAWNDQQDIAGTDLLGYAVSGAENNGDVPTSASLISSSQTNAVARRFDLYTTMPPAPNRPPLPSKPQDFAKLLDFHQAIASLQSYPQLLRAFGLVIDVEVPLDFIVTSPNATGFLNIALVAFTPGKPLEIAPQWNFPETAYLRSATEFAAAPAMKPGAPQYVSNGLLVLWSGLFYLVQPDIDGAMFKAIALAETFALEGGQEDRLASGLTALRSGGLSLIASGRGLQLVQSIAESKLFNDAVDAGQNLPRPLFAQDLIRGYRVDIWSSQDGQWHSLHRRNGKYFFGENDSVSFHTKDEEGFNQLSVAQPANDPSRPADPSIDPNLPSSSTDLYVHERVARWTGWSLSVPRPGKSLNRSPDPHHALDDDPTVDEPVTPFKMKKQFRVVPGSLPELRFGRQYRVRARTVDVAGNSIPLRDDEPGDSTIPTNPTGTPYLRYEPVPAPDVAFRELDNKNGSSLRRLVIRTHNTDPSLDTKPTSETAERHIVPPRIDIKMAEHHAMFDDASGKLKSDAATYDLIVTKDSGKLPTQDAGDAQHTKVPVIADAIISLPYFPDPFSRGAALGSLLNTPANTTGTITAGNLVYAIPPNAPQRSGSTTLIPFDGAWPEFRSFRLELVEGEKTPSWDPSHRELTVSLPKATTWTVPLSSYIHADELRFMGVWEWIKQYVDALNDYYLSNGVNDPFLAQELNEVAAEFELITRYALEGGHWALTPSHELALVHAVQQPIGLPEFDEMPVQKVSEPILLSEPNSAFQLVTGWRAPGSKKANLIGGITINGASTLKIDLVAQWTDPIDTGTGDPSDLHNSTHVDEIPLPTTEQTVLIAPGADQRQVGFYLPEDDAIWFANDGEEIVTDLGPESPGLAAPQHDFGDTKHHVVEYQAIATSRFREYFPPAPDQQFTRTSSELTVDIPSSARPLAPSVLYVVPTFGWTRELTTNIQTSVRSGRGLRVYLDRPWYSSGADELLGIVLWPGADLAPSDDQREAFKPFFTQWGLDPIWQTSPILPVPAIGDFPEAVANGAALTLDNVPDGLFDVAGHAVHFDKNRNAWYCDITFTDPQAYSPFVRLALARYQPHSITGVELSRVVLADFAQLTPDRSLVVTREPFDPRSLRVIVAGTAPEGPNRNQIDIRVQKRVVESQSEELGWLDAPANDVTITPQDPMPTGPDAALWAGTITFTGTPQPGRYRLLVTEYEVIPEDFELILLAERQGKTVSEIQPQLSAPGFPGIQPTRPIPFPFPMGTRLVYVDTIPLV
ncbi:MAG: hypothetical protein JO170_16810 [Verrucomicrobia bacterium]|nr:hypothetical protein [Verrucomicrobiota bacterium]